MTAIIILAIILVIWVVVSGIALVQIFEALRRHRKMIDFVNEDAEKALKIAHDFHGEHIKNYFDILRDWKRIREAKNEEFDKKDLEKDEKRLQETWEIVKQTSEIKKND